MTVRIIEVRCWGKTVGAIARDPKHKCYAFGFDPAWKRDGVDLAPLMMPVANANDVYVFPTIPEATYHGLPGMLADGLPDDFGNVLIDVWMAKRGFKKSNITALDRLAYVGKRGLGALEFHPPKAGSRESSKPIEMCGLVREARRVVSFTDEYDVRTKADLANIIRVGTSAGGARAKAVVAWNPDTREMRSGQFEVAEGFEHWLLKLDGAGEGLELGKSLEHGKVEYAYYLMASAAGVVMSPCGLLNENGRSHFMTKRFDRDGNTKHHVQTLCALTHLDFRQRATHAYEQYFIAIKQLSLGIDAAQQAFRRMVFNIAARNCDDHTKNFGFILKKGGQWDLTPAYDVTPSYNPKGVGTSQHLMSVGGKFDGISADDMIEVARRFQIPDARAVIEDVKKAIRRWSEFANTANVSGETITKISSEFPVI